ncbi:MAG: lipopolysaccharide transport system permease protein [Halioglobus sp.]|jgi:lipopolysaccharide transport system permease protein
MKNYSGSLWSLVYSLFSNRSLIASMAKREVISRYRGSLIGLAWSFLNPILLLLVYTFVFSVVFKARWGGSRFGEGDDASVAIMIFTGMIVHALFSECIVRSPRLITGNVNFVKRVVFPLEILPWVAMGAASFHTLVSLLVLIIGQFILAGHVPWTALLIPIVFLPLILMTMGFTWLFAASGVYFRDLSQLSAFISTILLFLSPVFYPLSAIPEKYQAVYYLNPLTYIIEVTRDLLIAGQLPSLIHLSLYFLASLCVAMLGFSWFQKTRRGFADVL